MSRKNCSRITYRIYSREFCVRLLQNSIPNRQLMELGLDSLMSVELINRLEGDLGVGVPTGQLGMKSIFNLVETLIPLLTGNTSTVESVTSGKEKPTYGEGMTISIGRAEDLSETQLLSVLQHRYDMYSRKNLINADSGSTELPDVLKDVLGDKASVSRDLKIDFDEYDFLPSCYHLTVESEDEIVGYLRLICEEKGQQISARGIYSEEIDQISHGDISAEISRLIRPGANGNNNGEIDSQMVDVMDQMFEILDEFAEQKGIAHIFAQVHPTHGAIYESQGLFERKGTEKLCPAVNNAPAVLMHRAVLTNN